MKATLSIEDLIRQINSEKILLPKFQRNYVWKIEQVKNYFNSLYNKYPTGYFLLWSSLIENDDSQEKNIKYILDGQQRITTIYYYLTGTMPSWINAPIQKIKRLYFDLENEIFLFDRFKNNSSIHFSLIDVTHFFSFNNFGDYINSLTEGYKTELFKYIDRFQKIGQIKDYSYHIDEIYEDDIDKVVRIFDLVNSSGTKLNNIDLAVAVMTGKLENYKFYLNELQKKASNYGFKFDESFLARALVIISTDRGNFSEVRNVKSYIISESINKLRNTLDYITEIMPYYYGITNTEMLTAYAPLYFIIYYLAKNNFQFNDDQDIKNSLSLLYLFLFLQRYTGATESKLDHDIRNICTHNSLDNLLYIIFKEYEKNIFFEPNDLINNSPKKKTIFQVITALIFKQDPYDWIDESISLRRTSFGNMKSIAKHSIFPKRFIKEINEQNDDKYYTTLIDSIANTAIVSTKTSKHLFDKYPHTYLKKLKSNELEKQFIPQNSDLWNPNIDSFKKFINERAELIAKKLNGELRYTYNKMKNKFEKINISQNNKSKNILSSANNNNNNDKNSVLLNNILDIEEKIKKMIYDASINRNVYASPKKVFNYNTQQKILKRIRHEFKDNPQNTITLHSEIRNLTNYFDLYDCFNYISHDNVWQHFECIFHDYRIFREKFNQIKKLRNKLAHSSSTDDITIKEGEAGIIWFNNIFSQTK